MFSNLLSASEYGHELIRDLLEIMETNPRQLRMEDENVPRPLCSGFERRPNEEIIGGYNTRFANNQTSWKMSLLIMRQFPATPHSRVLLGQDGQLASAFDMEKVLKYDIFVLFGSVKCYCFRCFFINFKHHRQSNVVFVRYFCTLELVFMDVCYPKCYGI